MRSAADFWRHGRYIRMDSKQAMGTALKGSAALVSFSGGQDSTTALACALRRYEIVETVGFRYGQKHFVEMDRRPVIREAISEYTPIWKVTSWAGPCGGT